MLRDFLHLHRAEILSRSRRRVAARNSPPATEFELNDGLPAFLDQLGEALKRVTARETSDHTAITKSAGDHGHFLFDAGLTVGQVVHDYGDLCQVITLLAGERGTAFDTAEFQTLNLCLDDAIAGAVTEYAHQRERLNAHEGTERLGVLAHEMRNLLNAAVISFASIKAGLVAPGGSTGAIHERSLLGLQTLIDRSLADVRLDAGISSLDRVSISSLLEEVEIGASMLARTRGVDFALTTVERGVIVEADRQILSAAIVNLLQNAFKFTRPGSKVRLTASTTADRVLLDVVDECGGLPSGKIEDLLRPFEQRGGDRSGLGLGLAICFKAVKAMAGELRIRDVPSVGCVFTIDLPRQAPSMPSPRD